MSHGEGSRVKTKTNYGNEEQNEKYREWVEWRWYRQDRQVKILDRREWDSKYREWMLTWKV